MARARSSLRAFERDQGTGLERLPWAAPKEAAAALDGTARARLAAFRRAVGRAWLSADAATALAQAFVALDPISCIAMHPGARADGMRWFRHTIQGRLDGTTPFHGHDALPRMRRYTLRRRDHFANQPVSLVPLVRAAVAAAQAEPLAFFDAIFVPNQMHKQLRMVLYDGSEIGLYLGQYRRQQDAPFAADDHALLFAARPTFHAWVRIARTIGTAPLGENALASALAALSSPALLLDRARVVFANRAGHERVAAARAWIRAGRPAGFADVTALPTRRGTPFELVFPFGPSSADPLAGLPPFLRRTGDHLVGGASDKEIAVALAMPLATVRTYVTRIYARLGVRSRRDLMR